MDWRLAALRIGRSFDRSVGMLVGGDDLCKPVELSYYVWCLKHPNGGLIVVDGGFTEELAKARNIKDFRAIPQALSEVGVKTADVQAVVLTHLHWDHMAAVEVFPVARFIVSRREWDWTFQQARKQRHIFNMLYDLNALKRLHSMPLERFIFVDEEYRLAPGALFRVVGGHTPGFGYIDLEGVTSHHTRVILLGDLAYLMVNLKRWAAPLIAYDQWACIDVYDQISCNKSGALVLPGHDPEILGILDDRLSTDIAVLY